MYVSLFDIDLNHITNLSNITGTLITKVYDFDEIKLSGNDTMGVNINELNQAKWFRLNEDDGAEIYSGLVYKVKKIDEAIIKGESRKSYNLFDGISWSRVGNTNVYIEYVTSAVVRIKPNTTYTIKRNTYSNRLYIMSGRFDNGILNPMTIVTNAVGTISEIPLEIHYTITTGDNDTHLNIYLSNEGYSEEFEIMVNEGTTPLPYEPYYEGQKSVNGGTVEIIGNDFLTYLDTDVFIDYKNSEPPIIIYSIFRVVTDQLKNAPPLEVRIPLNFIIPLDDLGIDFREVFGELPLEMFGTNGYKYMLPFLKYYGVRIIASYDWADDSPINFEFTRDRNTHKIRLKDFTFDLSQNQPTINKTLAIMTGGNPIFDPELSRYYYLTTDNQIVQGDHEGRYQKISETDLEIADYYITDTLKNRIYDDNGTLMLEQKVEKLLGQDTSWYWNSSTTELAEFVKSVLIYSTKQGGAYQDVTSNYFDWNLNAKLENVEGIYISNRSLKVMVRKDRIPNWSDASTSYWKDTRFKNWLQLIADEGVPLIIHYELETPIIRSVETTMVDILNRYYPVKTKIFIEDYLAHAQQQAVYELANNRYVDSITIDANSPLNPIDLSKVGLFDLIEIYDTDYQKTLPVSEKHLKISEKGIEFKLKLGFKKERLTEIIRYTT